MDGLGSECSSGCESGWTLYFEDRAGFSEEQNKKVKGFEVEDEEEEDLSMVSDASSGPPHFDDHFICLNGVNNGYFFSPPLDDTLVEKKVKKQRTKDHHQKQKQCNNLLDDTASSRPVFNFSRDNFFQENNQSAMGGGVLEFSQGFSTNHFQGGSGIRNHIGSSPSQHQLQHNQLSILVRKLDVNEVKEGFGSRRCE